MTPQKTDLKRMQKALDKAISTSDVDAIQKASRDLVIYHQSKGETEMCVVYVKSLLPYLRLPGRLGELAHNLDYLGKCLCILEKYQESEEFYMQAWQIYDEKGIELGKAGVETDLGMLFRHKGNFDISLEHLNKAIAIYQDNLPDMEANPNPQAWKSYIDAIECCGVIYGQLHQLDLSVKYLENTLALKERFGPISAQVSALMNLGAAYSQSDIDKAAQYYLRALELTDENTPTYHRAIMLNNLGGCLEDQNRLNDALSYYQKALEVMDSDETTRYQAPVYKHIGTVYYKQGRYEEALNAIEKSMNLAQGIDAKSEIKDCYLTMSDIYSAKQDYKKALNYRVKYDEIREEIFNQEIGIQLNSLQKKYENTSLNVSSLRQEKSLISSELKKAMNTGFVGVSPSIKEVQRLALEASIYKDTRALITGESGVGKEIVARYIHYSDSMDVGRFVDVNCCAIPDSMAESEFFGYVKGAFTGAMNNKEGFFELANHGTLFLDEIGDMPLDLQAKLLRVLETKQIKRLGSNSIIKVGFRLISATNKVLPALISENRFRADLLYRINTIQIHIPPLRERKEDIEPLLDYYLNEYSRMMNKPIPVYGPEVLNCLNDYSFPGNIRELKNMIERTMIFLKGRHLRKEDFTSQMIKVDDGGISVSQPSTPNRREAELQQILQAVKDCDGNQTLAAQKMGMPYSTFRRKYNSIRKDK